MNVIGRLAFSLGRRDEAPNIQLANEISETENAEAVKVLTENLSQKNKAIQSDCIKVLYELGRLKPAMISDYFSLFLGLLTHKNNRLQWGSMIALDSMVSVIPNKIFEKLPQILDAAEKGSAITRDYAVNIMVNLAQLSGHLENVFPLLMEVLEMSPTNQLPRYAEKMLTFINSENKAEFLAVLNSRLEDMEAETKRKRVEKVIRKLSNS